MSGKWPPWQRFGKGNRTAEELDVGVWQEMQRDGKIRARLRELAGEDEEELEAEAEDVQEVKQWRRRWKWLTR